MLLTGSYGRNTAADISVLSTKSSRTWRSILFSPFKGATFFFGFILALSVLPILIAMADNSFVFRIEDESDPYLESFSRYMGLDCDHELSEEQKDKFDNEQKRALYYLYLSKYCGQKENIKLADYYRGQAFYKQGKMAKAVHYLSQAMESGLDNPNIFYFLGKSHFELRHYDKAIQYFQKTVAHKSAGETIKNLARKDVVLAKASKEAEISLKKSAKSFKKVYDIQTTNEIELVSFKTNSRTKGKAKLSEFNNKLLVLHFWATWCVPCRKEFKDLLSFHKKYKEHGLSLVTMSLDYDFAIVEKFLKDQKIPQDIPVFYDQGGRLLQQLTSSVLLPTTIFFDESGKAVWVKTGILDWKDPELTALVKNTLQHK